MHHAPRRPTAGGSAGTGKDHLEAVAAHILTERIKGYPATKNFEGLLAAVFLQLGLALPIPDGQPPKGKPVQRQLERAMFNLAISLNRLRNKEGTARSAVGSVGH